MLKKCTEKIRGSLTVRIFLLTALILFAACGATCGFIVWATPLSYRSMETDMLEEVTHELSFRLQDITLADSGPLLDRFWLDTGAIARVLDADGNDVTVSTALSEEVAYAVAEAIPGGKERIVTEEDSVAIVEDGRAGEDHMAAATEEDSFRTPFIITSAISAGEKEKRGLFSNVVISVTSSAWEVPFSFQDDPNTVYTLVVTGNVTAVNQAVEAMGRVLPYLAVVVLTISLLGAVIYSRYITKPIVRLSSVSEGMAALDFSGMWTDKRRDEIGVLGTNLNRLSASLSTALTDLQSANAALQADIDRERELERQRSAFFSAASHELKTPITVLRGQLSGMLAEVDVYRDRDTYLAKSLAVTGRMEKLVREMLTISRMEQDGFALKWETVDLSALVAAQTAQTKDLAMQKNQTIAAEILPGLTVTGDGGLLEKAVSNLLGNAVAYSPEGETVRVSLLAGTAGPVLTVCNGGAAIPEESMPHLFEAFYRVEGSRNRSTGGSGLGLYLVKMILDRHGADCKIESAETGVRATVHFGANPLVFTQNT